MEVELSSCFKKSFRSLPLFIQKKAILKMKIFKENPFDPRLETHKLHGKRKEEWGYSIDRSYRISFIFLEYKKVLYTDIGTHEQVY